MLRSSQRLPGRSPLVAACAVGADRDPSRVAVTDATGTFAWRSVLQAVRETADAMDGPHDRFGALDLTGAELLIVMLAAASVGRSVCTLHGDWSDPELEAALHDADVAAVFTPRATVPGDAAIRRPPALTERPAAGPATERSVTDGPATDTDTGTDAADDPLFYVGFTSGSSGRPKPFTRRQRSWSTSFAAAAELFSVSSATTVVLAGNLQHSHFLFGAMLGWSQGALLRLYDRFDPQRLARDLGDEGPTVLYLVPTMLTALDDANVAPLDGVRSVVVSGAKMERHHWQIAARLFPGAGVAELYGASETSFITVNRRGMVDDDPGYVGLPFPGVELEIRPREDDDAGRGMVHVRSPYLFDGYLEAGTVVGGVPADGFVTVGDLGTIRPDGALSLRGRASNLIITGGKNVHAEEVELVLVTHPGVAECVVVGAPHPHWGEELVACVVPAPGADGTGHELDGFLRSRIAAYKIPKRWLVVPGLPRLPTGKLDRQRVRGMAASPPPTDPGGR